MIMKEFDAIIIGFGKGGKTLAADLSRRNWNVAVVERSDKMYGGTCINIGCIPTKTLVHQAKIAWENRDRSFEEKAMFYKNAISVKNNVTKMLRDKNYHNLADRDNVTVFNGIGSFIAKDTVAVRTDKDEIQLKAKKIFINTGAETVLPPIEGIQGNPYVYTSTSIMEVQELPKRLVIVGGGYIGLEFASMYASFGSEVTVLESYPTLIGREDRDIADSVKAALEKKGISFKLNVKVQTILQESGKAVVSFLEGEQQQTLGAEAVLLATGRRPATKGLNLEVADVKRDDRGAILVDSHLHTTIPISTH